MPRALVIAVPRADFERYVTSRALVSTCVAIAIDRLNDLRFSAGWQVFRNLKGLVENGFYQCISLSPTAGVELMAMMLRYIQQSIGVVLLCFLGFSGSALAVEKIIIDTDMGADVDDVGAVALANYYMGLGQAELLAVMVSNVGSQGGWAAAASDAVNTYYKHPNVMLGTNRGPATALAGDGSEFTRHIGSNASRYGHDHNQFDVAEDAVSAYRRLLSSQPDGSVNLVVVGWMSNIANLMDSGSNHGGDGINSTGKQLLERKLKRLVVMGGRYPSGLEFNFKFDGASVSRVISQLQVPMVFTGYELGTLVQTGQSLVQTPANNPVREAYRLYGNGIEPFNRSSWDLTAVLYVVEGLGDYFSLSAAGRNHVNGDGSNSWVSGHAKGDHYLLLKDSQARYRLRDRLNHILSVAPAPEVPSCNLAVSLAPLNPSCSADNGSIGSSVSGGTAPYQYQWSNGSTQADASALGGGSYSLSVSDASGCSASASVALAGLSMSTDIQHASDTHLGSIRLSFSGGRAPLSYNWSTGSTDRDIDGLVAGSYSVAVSDTAGCTLNKTLQVEVLATSPEHYLEAECAADVGTSWFESSDSAASGQLVLSTNQGEYNMGPDGSAQSTLRYDLNLDSAGDYKLHARIEAVDQGQDSVWYRINGSDWVAWHVGPHAQLSWVKLSTPVAFRSGRNTLEIAFREGGLALDKLYVTQAVTQPVGAVGEASNCGPQSCPAVGTPCDDGDPLTINDRADGNCGCAGTAVPQNSESHALDAECAADIGSDWQAFYRNDAAKGSAIRVADDLYNLTPSHAAATRLSFQFEHGAAEELQLFARVDAPDAGSDSVWMRVNGGEWQAWHFGDSSGFEWRRWWSSIDVEAGDNVVDFAFREGGLALDKISLSASAALPQSYGEQSSNCGPQSCPAPGLACDDGNANTYNDVTDGHCNCAGTPFGSDLIALEAECATDQGDLWLEDSSELASREGYVAVPLGSYNMQQNGDAETELSFSLGLETAGDYHLYTHTLTPDAGSDSLWYQIDEGPWHAWHLGVSQQFNWQRHYQVIPISTGQHTVRVAFREGGMQLDKLVLSQGEPEITGTGPEANNCN